MNEIFHAVALGLVAASPVVAWHGYQIIKSKRTNKAENKLFLEREQALDDANDRWIERANQRDAQRRAKRRAIRLA